MRSIEKFLKWLNAGIADADRKRREAYLAQATDHHDLERRMRELERASAAETRGW